MQIVTNPFIRSIMLFFLLSTGFDLVSRVWLNPKQSLVPPPLPTKESSRSTDNETKSAVFDSESFEVKEGTFVGDKNKIYSLYVDYCESCGFQKKFEEIKSELEKYRNVIVEARIIPKSLAYRLAKKTFTYTTYGTIGFIVCNPLYVS